MHFRADAMRNITDALKRSKKLLNFSVGSLLLTSGINRQKESVDIDQKESGWNDHFQPI